MNDPVRDIGSEPFGPEFDNKFFFRGFQHASALTFLERAVGSAESMVALTGCPGAGKRSTLEYFLREGAGRFRRARLKTVPEEGHAFLHAVLQSFGFGPVEADRAELRNLLSVFIVQVQHEGQRLLLHIDNPPLFSEDVAEEILWLTGEQSGETSIKIVLTGAETLDQMIDSPRMAALTDRLRLRHRIDPMSARETCDYLHHRLTAAGCARPADVFNTAVATAIYAASGGVPALVNNLSAALLEAVDRDSGRDLDVELVKRVAVGMGLSGIDAVNFDSRLEISLEGETFLEVPVGRDKLLIGRHSFNDICLRDNSVSRHHAIVVPDGVQWVIVDLNSTNGTRVNGKSVRQQVLSDGDHVRVGRFDLTFKGGGSSGSPSAPPEDSTGMRRTVVLSGEVKAVN